MGTTQRINSGVKNEPNWGNLSTSITSLAKTIEEIDKLDSEENEKLQDANKKEDEVTTPSENSNRYIKLESRKKVHIATSINRLVKIGGGSKNISSGNSSKIGRAGLKTTSRLVAFFASVSSTGIEETLNKIGFGSLQGKCTKDVIAFLTDYCGGTSIGMDEIAAKSALCEVLKELTIQTDDDISSLETLMKSYIDHNQLSNILCVFFGKYIYEYLWERLEERLRQIRGEQISKETFISINSEIQGRVKLLNSNRSLSKINWVGDEGKVAIENIFEAILKIEG